MSRLVPKLTVNKYGLYLALADAKCWYCQPEPTKLDRVFVITSVEDNNVSLLPKVSDKVG